MMKLNIQLFGSTNKTANYDLPQFVGTDKPTWLGDVNTAMANIDTGMSTNASAIQTLTTRVTSAEGVATQASNDVDALESTVSTLQTNVQSATTTANNAQSTASSALNTANSANSKADTNATTISGLSTRVDTLESDVADFNLTTYGTGTVTRSTGTYTLNQNELSYALNSDGSLAKIYGQLNARNVTASGVAIMNTPLRPEEDIVINGGAIAVEFTSAPALSTIRTQSFTIKTNGDIEIPIASPSNGQVRMIFINSLIYVKHFGDTPISGD